MNQEKIGQFIAESRKKKRYTQEQLAEKLGVTNRSVSRWENGKNMPDVSLFMPLCQELDITVNELLEGELIEKEKIEKLSEENIIAYSKYLKSKSRAKLLALSFVMFCIVFVSLFSIVLGTNKTFTSTVYHSEFYDNINISIPRFSYYRSVNGVELHTVKLKTLKQIDEVDIFIESYLSGFEHIECEDKIYYYNSKADFTITQYMINNDGIGFINTIYIGYCDGRYPGDS